MSKLTIKEKEAVITDNTKGQPPIETTTKIKNWASAVVKSLFLIR